MKRKNSMTWAVVIATAFSGLVSCNLDIPTETQTSFETMTQFRNQTLNFPISSVPE